MAKKSKTSKAKKNKIKKSLSKKIEEKNILEIPLIEEKDRADIISVTESAEELKTEEVKIIQPDIVKETEVKDDKGDSSGSVVIEKYDIETGPKKAVFTMHEELADEAPPDKKRIVPPEKKPVEEKTIQPAETSKLKKDEKYITASELIESLKQSGKYPVTEEKRKEDVLPVVEEHIIPQEIKEEEPLYDTAIKEENKPVCPAPIDNVQERIQTDEKKNIEQEQLIVKQVNEKQLIKPVSIAEEKPVKTKEHKEKAVVSRIKEKPVIEKEQKEKVKKIQEPAKEKITDKDTVKRDSASEDAERIIDLYYNDLMKLSEDYKEIGFIRNRLSDTKAKGSVGDFAGFYKIAAHAFIDKLNSVKDEYKRSVYDEAKKIADNFSQLGYIRSKLSEYKQENDFGYYFNFFKIITDYLIENKLAQDQAEQKQFDNDSVVYADKIEKIKEDFRKTLESYKAEKQKAVDMYESKSKDYENLIKSNNEKLMVLNDNLTRSRDEYNKLKERTAKELKEKEIRSGEEFINNLLPVIDNFALAVKSALAGRDISETEKGFVFIYNQLEEFLKKEGVEKIATVGTMFDPQYHEAVELVSTKDHPEQTVIEEVRGGYVFRGKILRPSMVKVAKN